MTPRGRCTVIGCKRPAHSRRRCSTHYSRWWRKNRLQETCSREGCERPHNARGLCSTHYARARKAGALPPPRRGATTYRVDWSADGIAWRALEGSAGELLFARGVMVGASTVDATRDYRIVKLRGFAVVGVVERA